MTGTYKPSIPKSLRYKALNDLRAYKKEHKLSHWALAKKIGVTLGSIQSWCDEKKQVKLQSSAIMKLIEAGVTTVKLPEQARNEALSRIMQQKDKQNKVPRKYTRRVEVPNLVRDKIKIELDGYVQSLKEQRTWEEHEAERTAFIDKLVFLARQGE
jgi:hypothetical protein